VVSHVDVLVIAGNNADIDKLLEKEEPPEDAAAKKHSNGKSRE
jgi:hypothetical protein